MTVLKASYWRQPIITSTGKIRPTLRTLAAISVLSRKLCSRQVPMLKNIDIAKYVTIFVDKVISIIGLAKFFSVQPPPVQESVQEPVQEPRTCGVCLVEPLNAIWQCGHLLCVECAKKIKAHQTRALRVCHLCRAPAKSFIEIRGTY